MSDDKKSRIEEIAEQFPLDRSNPDLNAALMLMVTEHEELKSKYEAEKHKAKYDGMTGLERRENLQPSLEREFSRAGRHNENLSVLMIDADNFGDYNNTYLHLQGDKALETIGAIVRSHLRKEDIAVRYGGEEICVILPETNEKELEQVAEKLRDSIERTVIPKRACKEDEEDVEFKDNGYQHITVSIGGVTYNPGLDAVLGLLDSDMSDEDKLNIIIGKADTALYEAKHSGKNKYCVANVE